MAKLPGWSFMLVGVAVSAYAKFIQVRTGANMVLPFWAGVLFVVFGFGREVSRLRAPKRPRPAPIHRPAQHQEQKAHLAGESHHATHHVQRSPHASYLHEPQSPHASHPNSGKICPRCDSRVPTHHKFCACGHQFY